MQKAFFTGVAGPTLTADEKSFVSAERPAGLILFSRNVVGPAQVRTLITEFRAAAGTDRVLVLVDQEGGRVQRLKPPLARLLPPAAAFAALYEENPSAAVEAARLVARLAADDLTSLGIDCNCAPVLDIPVAGAHDIIGNRAYGRAPRQIVTLGRAVASGLMDGGVLPVMKHIPGHGRANADSHLELPVVATSPTDLGLTDFAPFVELSTLPAAMTAHVVYSAIDPDHPASTSRIVIDRVIRGRMAFDGLLMSDDLSMKALSGSMRDRTRAVMTAGSDIALHCNGDLAEMRDVAAEAPALGGRALERFERALTVTRKTRQTYDRAAAESALSRIMAIAV